MTSSPRVDLAAALADAGPPGLTVCSEEPASPPALPAMVIRPGQPYRVPGDIPHCIETWRLEIVCLVAIDTVLPLDQLDEMVTIARDVIRAWGTAAQYNGVRYAPADQTIGQKQMHGALVELDVHI